MNKSTFEEEIEKKGILVYTSVGDSMLPLIRQRRDLSVICKLQGSPRKYDVVLYKRDSGQYVLHRIMKVCGGEYVLCGDNRWHREYGVLDRQMIGVLSAVIRDGRELSIKSLKYRIYTHLWCDLFPVRVVVLCGRYCLRWLIKRCLEKEKSYDGSS